MLNKTLSAVMLTAVFASASNSALAQPSFKRCPAPSAVDGVVAALNMDVTLGLARVSDEWRKQLRSAAASDSAACFAVEGAMYDFVEEAARLRSEINKTRDEVSRLRGENELLKLQIKGRK